MLYSFGKKFLSICQSGKKKYWPFSPPFSPTVFQNLLLALGIFLFPAFTDAAFVKTKRTVMIQVFQWNWNSIAEECEREFGPMGISAVQVPPPQEHIVSSGSPWWERYQPVSYQIHSRSGTREQFRSMVDRCKKVGVDVYADVVLNHMSALSAGVGFAGTPFRHYEYNLLWGPNSFHRCGRNGNNGLVNFYDRFELHHCDLLGMADLNTGKKDVQKRLAQYLDDLLDLGVSGFRIDAAKHISPEDLRGIFRWVKRDHYRVLELILSPGEPVTSEEYGPVGDLNNFAYAYGVGQAFENLELHRLVSLPGNTRINSDEAVVFLENHDLERRPDTEPILSYRKQSPWFPLAMTYLLTWPYGYPQLYSGTFFSDYDAGSPLDQNGFLQNAVSEEGRCKQPFTCMHRLPWIKDLVKFRNGTDSVFSATRVISAGDFLSYGRGKLGHVILHAGSKARLFEVPTDLSPGKYCNSVRFDGHSSTECGEVDAEGLLRVVVGARSAFVIYAPGQSTASSRK